MKTFINKQTSNQKTIVESSILLKYKNITTNVQKPGNLNDIAWGKSILSLCELFSFIQLVYFTISQCFMVILLKRMYYQDFFQTSHKCQPYIGNSKNYNKKMGSPYLFSPYMPVILTVFSPLRARCSIETWITDKKSYNTAKKKKKTRAPFFLAE